MHKETTLPKTWKNSEGKCIMLISERMKIVYQFAKKCIIMTIVFRVACFVYRDITVMINKINMEQVRD